MVFGTSRRAAALVLALAVWSAGEAAWQVTGPGGAPFSLVVMLWAFVLPLPLLLAGRAPGWAALAAVAIVATRDAAEQRAPGAAAQSVVLLVALFLSEAGAPPRSFPRRGLAAGGLLVLSVVTMDLAGFGVYASPSLGAYAHTLTLAIGGVSAGVALRDRRGEAERREREVLELEAGAERRIDLALAGERARIASEVDAAVAMLLNGVRPLADRARHAAADEFAELMAAVHDRAQAAMLELRRAVRLLRTPDEEPTLAVAAGDEAAARRDGDSADARAGDGTRALGSAVAAARRTRVGHAVGLAAPVVLLTLLGLADRLTVAIEPFVPAFPVPGPVLGPASPWVTAVLYPLPLLLRRRWPVTAALAVFALVVARMLVHDLSTLTFSQFYAAAAVTFIGAAHARRRTGGVVVVAAGTVTSLVCMVLEEMPYQFYAYSFAGLLPLACGLGGLLVRDRVASSVRARRAHERADRAQEVRARERVMAERLAAARELHDVVGHAVTIITLQAAVAVRYAALDLARARRAGIAVAQVASDVQRDLVRLGAGAAPADDITRLAERSGLPVTLDLRVDAAELPLPLALTTVRIVQEALTNVGRHAGPVPVTVRLERMDERLVIEVVNAPGRQGVGAGGGRGLRGMLERVELYSGTLQAGPTGDGGWRVRAELAFEIHQKVMREAPKS
ncbi:hypothetical protein DVA67_001465 [Solirubrobacter sp. CPCC 204708]|uniref:histidine kinase n=1 Tax=Solirubrobacter deserti TaxID=2282478 RepID=A0ABT4RDL6_9ACTN|nr:histidine kinase [Solirubrobacter deserti]MBE2314625.1 hypothetical protein [Solirubrobacter deserti]MDA0136632.1 histidine kinase [Solirubrobacter deserti]